jgi:hypothetical protein
LPGALVERGVRDQLAEHLAVEAEGARLIHRDGSPDLTAELLQPIVVNRAELLDTDLGIPHFGERGAAEAAENVTDAPDGEAEREQA